VTPALRTRLVRAATLALLGTSWHTMLGQGPKVDVVPVINPAWSTPIGIVNVPTGRSLRWPSLSTANETVYVAGNLFPVDPKAPVGPRPLWITRIPGGDIPLPDGDFSFAFPRGAVDLNGNYHLVWAEPATRDQSRGLTAWLAPMGELWHAAFVAGKWSVPERILQGQTVNWHASNGSLAIDRSNRLHVIAPAAVRPGELALVYLRRSGESWTTREFLGGAGHATLVSWEADSLLAIFTAAEARTTGSVQGVFAYFSHDGGSSWSPRRTLSTSGKGAASALQAAYVGGIIHVVWGQNLGSSYQPDVLRYYTSRDGGGSWKALPDAPTRPNATHFNLAVTRCQSAHVLLEAIAKGPTEPRILTDEITWTSGAVSDHPLFPNFAMISSAGLVTTADTIRTIFSGVRRAGEAAQMMTAKMKVCQARRRAPSLFKP
jgi:hypothetical protein